MKRTFLDIACCPDCGGRLAQPANAPADSHDIESGLLTCRGCGAAYPIVGGIPRFVDAGNYTGSFGYQWTKFSRTQLDEHLGIPLSKERFTNELEIRVRR